MDAYEVTLWAGKAPDTTSAQMVERIKIKVPEGASEATVTRRAKCALGLEGMRHRRSNEGERAVLKFGEMFATIDTY